MGEKSEIIRELGNEELLLPGLITEALQANDRLKYYFTLLQTARSRADNPDAPFPDLSIERQAAGIQDSSLDEVVDQSSRGGQSGYYVIPHVSRIVELVRKDMEVMIAPLSDDKRRYHDRLSMLLGRQEETLQDTISQTAIDMMTAIRPTGKQDYPDTYHAIVMDAHRALNSLQASVYQESIDGAKIYGITESDRPLVKALMDGVNSTAKLKFDHPGLGTTATRSPEGLVIQNDIGETDAHALVVRIIELAAGAGTSVQATYTDIHSERLAFFQSLFEKFGTRWTETASRASTSLDDGAYLLTVGTYVATSRQQLEEYLYHLGSRIVFLIDWNKARKQLRSFVKKSEAAKVLRWAAQDNYGHMAFLKLGGEGLVIEAIERIPKVHLRYGQKLDEVLGEEVASEFLRFVLRVSSQLLLDGKSRPFIRDEITAELARRFHGIYESLLSIAALHAELVVDTSAAGVDAVIQILSQNDNLEVRRILVRAGGWETRADNLLNSARQAIKRSRAPPIVEKIISGADDAIDSIEEAIFLLSLTPEGAIGFGEPLRELFGLANRAAMEYLKAVECSKLVRSAGQDIIDDLLTAVDMTTVLEHEQDDAYRRLKAALVSGASDFRQLHVFAEIAAKIEQGTDSIMKSAILLREYVLEEVMAQ